MLARWFGAWKSVCVDLSRVGGPSRKHINAARVARDIRRISIDLRECLERDKAEHVRRSFEAAKAQGAAPLAALLRGILKIGRKFRTPKLSPLLLRPDGNWEADPNQTLQALGEHFAQHDKGVLRRQVDAEREVCPVDIQFDSHVVDLQVLA